MRWIAARIAAPREPFVIAGVIKHAAIHDNRLPIAIALVDNALDRLMREVRLVVADTNAGDEHSGASLGDYDPGRPSLALRAQTKSGSDKRNAGKERLRQGVGLGRANVQEGPGTAETVDLLATDPRREAVALQRQKSPHRDLFD